MGLKGEAAKYYAPEEQENVDWVDLQLGAPSAFIWYKVHTTVLNFQSLLHYEDSQDFFAMIR